MDGGPGLRRIPAVDLEGFESDPGLVDRIRGEIERTGPLTFARFMELALYDPAAGYYRSESARPGRGGDFLTAPEAHPIFGQAIARHVDEVWQAIGTPAGFTIRELGSGGGALAEGLLRGLLADGAPLAATIRYRPVEIESHRIDELRSRLGSAGLAGAMEADDGTPIDGVVLANEVLDALPTHRVIQRGRELREVFVGAGEAGFADVEGQPSMPALAARLAAENIQLADGQAAEICLGVDAWVAAAAAGLARGVLLIIDYGHPAVDLYDPVRRPTGTLAAYLGQRAHTDPYRAVGRQDLTAHVDVTAVERAAAASGLQHLGTTTQGQFLAALGAGEILVGLQTAPNSDLQAYLEARSALVRMIDPAAMGGFRVMAFGRGLLDARGLRGLG